MEPGESAVASCVAADDLLSAGNACDAIAVLRDAVSAFPQHPIVHALLARACLASGDAHGASEHFQRALDIEPHLIGVHAQYARMLLEQGKLREALTHTEAAYKPVHASESAYAGSGRPLRVLQIGSAVVEGLTETEWIVGGGRYQTTTIAVQYWQRGRALPPHDVVFNSIADPDRCAGALDVAEWILSQTRAPVLNPPDAVRRTGRLDSTRLSGIAGVVVPRIRRLRRSAILAGDVDFAEEGFDFPVLLREPGRHNGAQFFQAESPSAARESARAIAGDDVLAIEFVDTRRNGRFWKYRAMIVRGQVYPAHLAISPAWNVHYFSAQMGDEERGQEAQFLNDMDAAIGERAARALREIARRLGLDYAGIDFGLNGRGQVVVFEANAAMTVFVPPESPPNEHRRAAAFRIFAAARSMIDASVMPHR